MTPQSVRPRFHWLAPVIVVLAIAVVFGRISTHEWLHWDDDHNLWQNPDFNPVSLASVAAYWTKPHAQLYVPVTYTAWGILAAIAQRGGPGRYHLDPFPFHVASLVVHAAAALGVLALLRLLGAKVWAAAAGALLFATHPLQVEVVAWASGLKDLLAGAMGVWALWCYVRAALLVRDEPAPTSRARRFYVVGSALFIAAMLAKPQAVCLPLVAAVIGRMVLKRPWAQIRNRLATWLILTVPIVVIGHFVQPGGVDRGDTPVAARLLVPLDDLTFYLRKLFWPTRFSIDYAHTTARLLASGRSWVTWIPPAVVGVICLVTRRRIPCLAAAAALSVAGLLPVLGLVPFVFQDVSNVADHYVYVAMLGPALLVAKGLGSLGGRRAIVIGGVVTAGVLGVLGADAWGQSAHWRDDEALFTHALAVSPNAVRARIHLAAQRVRESRRDEAERLYREALALAPRDPVAHFNYANMLREQGRFNEASEHYRLAIDRSPNEAPFHTNLGLTLLRTGQVDQAISELQRSAELDPNNKQVWMALGSTLAQHGDLPSAAAALSQAVDIDPSFAPARQLLAQVRAAMQQQQASPPPSH